jgi:hypothetical protein
MKKAGRAYDPYQPKIHNKAHHTRHLAGIQSLLVAILRTVFSAWSNPAGFTDVGL